MENREWNCCGTNRIMYCVSLFIIRVRTHYARLIYSGVGRPREDPTARSSPFYKIPPRDRKQN